MSLKPQAISPVPEETARIAHAAYPKGNVYMHMRDELGSIYEDESFADLFSQQRATSRSPMALSTGDHHPICRGTFRSASR